MKPRNIVLTAIAVLLALALNSCTKPEPDPEPYFNQEVVDHDDVDTHWETL